MIEDNHLDTYLITSTLQAMNSWAVNITTVDDGEKAMNYLARNGPYTSVKQPDLVLLDLNLPRYNGLEILRYVRQESTLSRVKVFVFSSSPVELVRLQVESASLRAEQYFTKPSALEEFDALALAIRRSYFDPN